METHSETKRKYRSYTDEFKENLMELALRGDRTPRQVASDFGIPPRTLYGWLRDRGWTGPVGRPPAAPPDQDDKDRELVTLRARNAELERKVRGLEEDREILKKATAFFAKLQP